MERLGLEGRLVALCVCVVMLVSTLSMTPFVSGVGTPHAVTGYVYWPDGSIVDLPLTVTVTNNRTGQKGIVYVDVAPGGNPDGTYQVDLANDLFYPSGYKSTDTIYVNCTYLGMHARNQTTAAGTFSLCNLRFPGSSSPQFNIQLQKGWNLVSAPLELYSNSVSFVLSSITGKYSAVKYYNVLDKADPWETYRPGSAVNDLSSIDKRIGFWICATQNCTLTVYGQIANSTAINLYAGWNLVGYPTLCENMTIGNVFWGTGADRIEVFDPASPSLIKEVGPTYMMKPGDGYWVRVPADVIWTGEW
jgi:hypothetical protein